MEIRKARIRQLAIDFVLCLIVGLPYLAVWLLVDPFKRGFFCNDDSIKYPYREDTVSMGACAGGGIAVALISFACVEFGVRYGAISDSFRSILWQSSKIAVTFFVGAGLTLINIEVGKLTIGRPRPHFIYVCQPDFTKIDCSAGYIDDFTCQNTQNFSEKTLHEARKSFPSGHSGFSSYTAVFLSVYFFYRLRFGFSFLLSITLQLFVIVSAFYIMLSRISDYKHHWSDVLVGGAIGCFVAVWTIVCLGRHLSLRRVRHHTQGYDESCTQMEVEQVMASLPRDSAHDGPLSVKGAVSDCIP